MSIATSNLYETKNWTPVFNTSTNPFELPFKIDYQNLLKSREIILYPNTKVNCLNFLENNIVQIETKDYPSNTPIYTNLNFLRKIDKDNQKTVRELPSQDEIIKWLENQIGIPYCWGGNCVEGIKEIMINVYPHLAHISEDQQINAYCIGVDCSGLLYQATNGISPRNTRQLIQYGEKIPIEGLTIEEIQNKILPLDVVVFPGHMVICLDKQQVIESRLYDGVIMSSFVERFQSMQQLANERDKQLYVIRWYEIAKKSLSSDLL